MEGAQAMRTPARIAERGLGACTYTPFSFRACREFVFAGKNKFPASFYLCLMKKSILVTGGTKGIGRAVLERFARENFTLITCSRNQQDLNHLAKALSEKHPGIELHTFTADLSKREQVMQFAHAALERIPHIDVLVNNAGAFRPGNIADEPEGQLEWTLQTNLYSAYHLTRALLPSMLKRKQGHIINICSVASLKAYPQGGSYSISKYALLGFSHNLREELKDKGIRVTAIMPGATWSDSWKGVDLPRERLMEAEDVAKTVWCAWELGPSAVLEEVVLRPLPGDL